MRLALVLRDGQDWSCQATFAAELDAQPITPSAWVAA